MTDRDRSRTTFLLFLAAVYLGVGSFTLLLGPVLIIFLGASQFVVLFTGVGGSLLHLLAWIVLGQAMVALMRRPGTWPCGARWGMTAAFLISVLGWGLALVSMSADSIYLIPYSPAIYVPVIGAHGVIFLMGAGVLIDYRARKIVLGGGLLLLAVAAVSVAAVVSPFSGISSLLFWPPGISGFGYGIASIGWFREYRAVRQLAWEAARKPDREL